MHPDIIGLSVILAAIIVAIAVAAWAIRSGTRKAEHTVSSHWHAAPITCTICEESYEDVTALALHLGDDHNSWELSVDAALEMSRG